MADWIWISFGVVSRVGRGMGVLDGGSNCRREGQFLGVNLGHPTVTDGDFVAQMCESDTLFPDYFRENLFKDVMAYMIRAQSCITCSYSVFIWMNIDCLQCFDAVGWAAGRASGL